MLDPHNFALRMELIIHWRIIGCKAAMMKKSRKDPRWRRSCETPA
jgi:hypothetical protein